MSATDLSAGNRRLHRLAGVTDDHLELGVGTTDILARDEVGDAANWELVRNLKIAYLNWQASQSGWSPHQWRRQSIAKAMRDANVLMNDARAAAEPVYQEHGYLSPQGMRVSYTVHRADKQYYDLRDAFHAIKWPIEKHQDVQSNLYQAHRLVCDRFGLDKGTEIYGRIVEQAGEPFPPNPYKENETGE